MSCTFISYFLITFVWVGVMTVTLAHSFKPGRRFGMSKYHLSFIATRSESMLRRSKNPIPDDNFYIRFF